MRRCGRHDKDTAAAALFHLLGEEFAQYGRRFDVQRYYAVDFLYGSAGQRIENKHARIVYENLYLQSFFSAKFV